MSNISFNEGESSKKVCALIVFTGSHLRKRISNLDLFFKNPRLLMGRVQNGFCLYIILHVLVCVWGRGSGRKRRQ